MTERARLELDRDAALVLFEMLTRERPEAVVRARDSAEREELAEVELATDEVLGRVDPE